MAPTRVDRQNLLVVVMDGDFEAESVRYQIDISVGMRIVLTPGSVTDACTKDEMQIKNRYAKKTGTAGDTWCEKYGPLDDVSATLY